MKPDTLSALAGATLVWLVALPSHAANTPQPDLSFGTKSFNALAAICRVEARTDPTDPNRTIFIQPGMGDGGFPIATTSRKVT